ncbi:MAG: mechanosensitive ion channel family protein [Candidatus Woesearchaeota archaeon]
MAFDLSLILEYTLLGATGRDYLKAIIAVIATLVLLKIFKFVILKRLKAIAAKSETRLDDLICKIFDDIGWPFYILVGIYFGLKFLHFANALQKALDYVVLAIIIYYIGRILQDVIDYVMQSMIKKKQGDAEASPDPVIMLLGTLIKIAVWTIMILFLVSNLGFNITSLVAGLGIGGIAVALALQNILGDIFSSFSIYFDKPFKPGDFIVVGDQMGTVKYIGIKSTRIQSLRGEEVTLSNRELTTARVQNFKRMQKRRVEFAFGVTYQTPVKKLKLAKEMVKKVVSDINLAELDRVNFKQYGDFSLVFEVVFYVKSSDYNTYMNVREQINLGIKERFEKEHIEFAYPTQTVFLSK